MDNRGGKQIAMNYARIYDEFIADRRNKILGWGERHHVIPKCVGGNNSTENLILLSPEDHFFAHLLLAKIFGGKLNTVAWLMANKLGDVRGRHARKIYGWLRRKFAAESSVRQKERMRDPAIKGNMIAALTGKPKSAEAIAKRAMKMKGVKINFSPDQRLRLADRLRAWLQANPDHYERLANKRRGSVMLPEYRERISSTLKGHAVSDETRQKLRQARLGKTTPPLTRAKQSAALKGRDMLPSQLANLTKMNQKGRPGFALKPETKAKLSAALSGRQLTPEHRAKIAEAHQRRAAAAAARVAG